MPFPVPGRIAEMLRRCTVQIRSGAARQTEGTGSGIALNDGRILTNVHVIAGSEVTVEAWDGASQRAQVAKTDRHHDLALLVVEKLDVPAATFASNEAKPGQAVIAVGNPLGFIGAVSTGFIQRVGIVRGLGGRRWVQADLRLAPGNSGGPLADVHGEVIGVNTMVAGGLALSIPANAVQTFLSEGWRRRELGVVIREVMLPSQRPALMILEVKRNGPAESASLLPGDLLVRAGERPLTSADDLYEVLSSAETLHLSFLRGGNTTERRVTVQLAPSLVETAA